MLLYQNNYRMDKPVFTTSNLNKRKKLIKCRELTLARSLQMEILIQSWIANQPASPPPCDMRHCLCIRIITNPTTIIAIDTNRCKFIISRKLTLDIGITAKIPNEFTWKKKRWKNRSSAQLFKTLNSRQALHSFRRTNYQLCQSC